MLSEAERLSAYRQLRTQIRSSAHHLIVGIDIAKEKHHAFFGMATGKVLCQNFTFPNSKEGFELLLSRTEQLRIQQQLDTVVFGMEPTANYHKPLADHLVRLDQQVVQVSGVAVKQNRELLDGRWDKHDRKDAANVGDLIAQGKCQFYEYPSLEIRQLRELLSLKHRFKKEEHGLKTRIRNNLLAKFFPEMDQFINTCQQDTLSVIGNCCAPELIGELDYPSFFTKVVPVYKGKRQEAHLMKIWQAAQSSIGFHGGELTNYEGQLLIRQLQHVGHLIREIEEHIEAICSGFDEYACLLSIPGVGPDISSKLLAYIGDPHRFETASQVIKLAGLDLSASRSGKPALKATPVISKRGNADLRYALCHAAKIASMKNAFFRSWSAKQIKGREREEGIFGIVRVKLAAKLLVIAWTLMKNKEMFAYEKLNYS
ncbi:MAG: IS110 family transposase [Chlorobiales bacterium]|nr:IS110 family transposase [Chlorobiales bacterium]